MVSAGRMTIPSVRSAEDSHARTLGSRASISFRTVATESRRDCTAGGFKATVSCFCVVRSICQPWTTSRGGYDYVRRGAAQPDRWHDGLHAFCGQSGLTCLYLNAMEHQAAIAHPLIGLISYAITVQHRPSTHGNHTGMDTSTTPAQRPWRGWPVVGTA